MLKKDDKKESRSIGKFEATRCKFEKYGRPCRLTGTSSSSSGEEARFYCAFHNDVLVMSDDLNTFAEFKQWHKDFLIHYPLKLYGNAQYEKGSGKFTGFRGGDFHDENTKKLWAMMGNSSV